MTKDNVNEFDIDVRSFLKLAEELDKNTVFKCEQYIWKMSPEQRKKLFYSENFREVRREYAEFMVLYGEDDVDDIRELISDIPVVPENFGVKAGLDLISIKEMEIE